MPKLADTVAMLASLKRRAAAQAEAFGEAGEAGKAALDGGWTTDAFAPNPGALRLWIYSPAKDLEGAPLVVVLHGCGQGAKGYAEAAGWTALADRLGFVVLAPEQTSANNPNRCFNWFEPGDAQRDRGEAASIRAMIQSVMRAKGLDPERVFVTGLSAGGAMTAVMLACYPEVFNAGAILAGVPYGVADTLQSALNAMYFPKAHAGEDLAALARQAGPRSAAPPRLSIWHGDADQTVKAFNAEEIARQWARLHGLPEEATQVRHLQGRTQALWRGGGADGPVLVERHLIHGMGHGTPLSAEGAEGLGAVGPFMLETGVSSSLEIARFWGLVEAPAVEDGPGAPRPRTRPGIGRSAPEAAPATAEAEGVGGRVLASLSQIVSDDVRHVIQGAFRVAGLK